jgi:hypothetical protein
VGVAEGQDVREKKKGQPLGPCCVAAAADAAAEGMMDTYLLC